MTLYQIQGQMFSTSIISTVLSYTSRSTTSHQFQKKKQAFFSIQCRLLINMQSTIPMLLSKNHLLKYKKINKASFTYTLYLPVVMHAYDLQFSNIDNQKANLQILRIKLKHIKQKPMTIIQSFMTSNCNARPSLCASPKENHWINRTNT